MGLYEENKDVYGLIIDNIKKYRKKRGLTQQGLSLRAHISKGYLSQIEAKNYNRFCSLDVLINIAQALEVPLYKLFLPPNVIFIDEAVSYGMSTVRILHGTGTGALRQSIRELLSDHPHVSSYEDERADLGGAGITIVHIG